MKGTDLEEGRRDVGDELGDYWKGTIWQRIAKVGKQNAEAFAQPQDTGHGTRDTGHGTRDTGHGTRDTGHGTRDTMAAQ